MTRSHSPRVPPRSTPSVPARCLRSRLLSRSALVSSAATLATLIGIGSAGAQLPTGGQVVAGDIRIGAGNGTAMTVYQDSATGIINWDSFSIGAGNQVGIANGAGATLNRVVGTDLSAIHGQLNASGSVYLINQNGIVIGDGGRINVGGDFVAATGEISDADFLDGGALAIAGNQGALVNLGAIQSRHGDVMLFGATVENRGQIHATSGTVGLGAGLNVRLQDAATGDRRVFVEPGLGGGATGVDNTGRIDAAMVELRAAGGNVYSLAVNNAGLVRAHGLGDLDGQVTFAVDGGNGDRIVVGGEVRAYNKTTDEGGLLLVDGGREADIRIAGGLSADTRVAWRGEGGLVDIRSGGGQVTLAVDAAVSADASTAGPGGAIAIEAAEIRAETAPGGEPLLSIDRGGRTVITTAAGTTVSHTADYAFVNLEIDAQGTSASGTIVIGDAAGTTADPVDGLPWFGDQGAGYVSGSGTFGYSDNVLTVDQSTATGIIEWDDFSIAADRDVRINNAGGATLNRVVGTSLSEIHGSLSSDGTVYLINENGILVGAAGRIDTAGAFVASTLDIADADFLDGGAQRFVAAAAPAAVRVEGGIISQLDSIVLAGGQVGVGGTGSLLAWGGSANLAAGRDVTWDSAADTLAVTSSGPVAGSALDPGRALIEMSGGVAAGTVRYLADSEIDVDGGAILHDGQSYATGDVILAVDGAGPTQDIDILGNDSPWGGVIESGRAIEVTTGGDVLFDDVILAIDRPEDAPSEGDFIGLSVVAGGLVTFEADLRASSVDISGILDNGFAAKVKSSDIVADAFTLSEEDGEGFVYILDDIWDYPDGLPWFGVVGKGFVHGDGGFDYDTTPGDLTITQTTATGIIEWDVFSVGEGQTVQINNGGGATLNRVVGTDFSDIQGSLFSDGALYLINENGIVVGETGVIQTADLFLASTLDVSDVDFLDGGGITYGIGEPTGNGVTNAGLISAGYDAVLIGARVTNEATGTIESDVWAQLLAGPRVVGAANDTYHIELDGAAEHIGGTGVSQAGAVRAKGDVVVAAAGSNVYDTSIHHTGESVSTGAGDIDLLVAASIADTSTIDSKGAIVLEGGRTATDGRIFITADDDGSISIDGTEMSATGDGASTGIRINAGSAGTVTLGSDADTPSVDFTATWDARRAVFVDAGTLNAEGYNVRQLDPDSYQILSPSQDQDLPWFDAKASGHGVVHGDAVLSYEGDTLTITQTTATGIINWDWFDISEGHTVQIDNEGGALLSRVVTTDVTEIYGMLQATGDVYLINRNGIVVGKSGVIDVDLGGFVASTLDIVDSSFIGQNSTIFGNGFEVTEPLVNHGSISAEQFTKLFGPRVENHGRIGSEGESITVVSALSIFMEFDDDDIGFFSHHVDAGGVGITQSGAGEIVGEDINLLSYEVYDTSMLLAGTLDASSEIFIGGDLVNEIKIDGATVTAPSLVVDMGFNGERLTISNSAFSAPSGAGEEATVALSNSYGDVVLGSDSESAPNVDFSALWAAGGDVLVETAALTADAYYVEKLGSLTYRILPLGYISPDADLPWYDVTSVGQGVVHGDAALAFDGDTLTITQSTATGIINWDWFDIGAGHAVDIQNGTGATLNRVTTTDLTEIYGTLTATGDVYLINQNGIVVGDSGVIDTGGLFLASALDVADGDWLNGGTTSYGDGTLTASSVSNAGTIATGGDAVLMGAHVVNTGSGAIDSDQWVELLAGTKVVADDGDYIPVIEDPAVFVGGDGVRQEGTIVAAGGVDIRAAGSGVYDTSIRHTGETESTGDGDVTLVVFALADVDGSINYLDTTGTIAIAGGRIASTGAITISAQGNGTISIDDAQVSATGGDGFTAVGIEAGEGGQVSLGSVDGIPTVDFSETWAAGGKVNVGAGVLSADAYYVEQPGEFFYTIVPFAPDPDLPWFDKHVSGQGVVSGEAAFDYVADTLTITQGTSRAIINWDAFDIAAGHTVHIQNGTGGTLNRVTSTDLSEIYGALTATGSIYLINENGIVIGDSGVIDVGSTFVASTLDVADEAWLDQLGGDDYHAGDVTDAFIRIEGSISANHWVSILSRQIDYQGTITTGSDINLLGAADAYMGVGGGLSGTSISEGIQVSSTGTLTSERIAIGAWGDEETTLTVTGDLTADDWLSIRANAKYSTPGEGGHVDIADAVIMTADSEIQIAVGNNGRIDIAGSTITSTAGTFEIAAGESGRISVANSAIESAAGETEIAVGETGHINIADSTIASAAGTVDITGGANSTVDIDRTELTAESRVGIDASEGGQFTIADVLVTATDGTAIFDAGENGVITIDRTVFDVTEIFSGKVAVALRTVGGTINLGADEMGNPTVDFQAVWDGGSRVRAVIGDLSTAPGTLNAEAYSVEQINTGSFYILEPEESTPAALPGSEHAGFLPWFGDQGAGYVSGSGTFGYSDNVLTVDQSTATGIIEWDDFSIAADRDVRINNAGGATLNRVVGTSLSEIHGSLSSDGTVYLINENGILVGAAGRIDTAGAFVASTLDIADADFLDGGAQRFVAAAAPAAVRVEGGIISQLDSIVLAGGQVGVGGTGSLLAWGGSANLAAGRDVTWDSAADTLAVTSSGPVAGSALDPGRALIEMSGGVAAGTVRYLADSRIETAEGIAHLGQSHADDGGVGLGGDIRLGFAGDGANRSVRMNGPASGSGLLAADGGQITIDNASIATIRNIAFVTDGPDTVGVEINAEQATFAVTTGGESTVDISGVLDDGQDFVINSKFIVAKGWIVSSPDGGGGSTVIADQPTLPDYLPWYGEAGDGLVYGNGKMTYSGALDTGITMTIDQSTIAGIIEWDGFNIGGPHQVHINNGGGGTLNRVVGVHPDGMPNISEIMGSLSASGTVYLINENGIVFGPSSEVAVGGTFFASTLDIADSDWLNGGNNYFGDNATLTGTMENHGDINAGRHVGLLAPQIVNRGPIHAVSGRIAMVAGLSAYQTAADPYGGMALLTPTLGEGGQAVGGVGIDNDAYLHAGIEVTLDTQGGATYDENILFTGRILAKEHVLFTTRGSGGTITLYDDARIEALADHAYFNAHGSGMIDIDDASFDVGGPDTNPELRFNAHGGTVRFGSTDGEAEVDLNQTWADFAWNVEVRAGTFVVDRDAYNVYDAGTSEISYVLPPGYGTGAPEGLPSFGAAGGYVAGAGTFHYADLGPGESYLTIDQTTQTGIIEWDDFSIAEGHYVDIQNGGGATLNRVVGTSFSQIDGTLQSDGSVYIVNDNGIVIGKSGVIDVVGDFVATTQDVTNADFMAGGAMRFTSPTISGSVRNDGQIISQMGSVVLGSGQVRNAGNVMAWGGSANLLAGRTLLIDLESDAIAVESTSTVSGPGIDKMSASITMDGGVAGGTVRYIADSRIAGNGALTHSGSSFANDGGQVDLGSGGDIQVSIVGDGAVDRVVFAGTGQGGGVVQTGGGQVLVDGAGAVSIRDTSFVTDGAAQDSVVINADGPVVFVSAGGLGSNDIAGVLDDGQTIAVNAPAVLAEGWILSNPDEHGTVRVLADTPLRDALPWFGEEGDGFVYGSGSFGYAASEDDGLSLTVVQNGAVGIIEWDGFSIGAKNTVMIDNNGGATLNRVVGQDLSSIYGSLLSDGSIYLINENGIVVNAGGVVDTGGLFVASSLDIDDQDWLTGGNDNYGDNATITGGVENYGDIRATRHVGLMGTRVGNHGDIQSSDGGIFLTAGLRTYHGDASPFGDFSRQIVGAADAAVPLGGTGVTQTGSLLASRQILIDSQGAKTYGIGADISGSAETSDDITVHSASYGIDGATIRIRDGATLDSHAGQIEVVSGWAGAGRIEIDEARLSAGGDGAGANVQLLTADGTVNLGSTGGEASVDFGDSWNDGPWNVQVQADILNASPLAYDIVTAGTYFYIFPPGTDGANDTPDITPETERLLSAFAGYASRTGTTVVDGEGRDPG